MLFFANSPGIFSKISFGGLLFTSLLFSIFCSSFGIGSWNGLAAVMEAGDELLNFNRLQSAVVELFLFANCFSALCLSNVIDSIVSNSVFISSSSLFLVWAHAKSSSFIKSI